MAALDRLQTALGYAFQDQALLRQALTHRSHGMPHNERLEFLGDSVLSFVISTWLFAEHGDMNEGDLSRVRARLVRQSTLAEIATRIELSDCLRLGEGELKSGGFRRPSILADALEALLGAIFLDGGHDAVGATIHRLYDPILLHLDPASFGKDPKTLLQELVQGAGLPLPRYVVVNTRGAAHDQIFDVACEIPQLGIRKQACGSSRRAAEQAAAGEAIQAFRASASGRRPGRRHRSALRVPPGGPHVEERE